MVVHEFLFDRENGTLQSFNCETGVTTNWQPDDVAFWRLRFSTDEEPIVLAAMHDVSIITGRKKFRNEESSSSPGTDTESS